jgi:transcriptional regulator with XRE-family HTH domain
MTTKLAPPAARRRALKQHYDSKPLQARLQQLLKAHNESYREAALRSSLDHQALGRVLRVGMRPAIQTCILLADHFDINPNELITLAGHAPLKMFEVKAIKGQPLPPEVAELALKIASIQGAATRKAVVQAASLLLAKYFNV